jgi:hypothetical protein
VSTPLRANQGFKKKGDQAIDIMIGDKNDISAPPSITTIRSPTRNEFFAAKAATAIPSVTGLGVHPYLIDKLHFGKVAELASQVDGKLPRQRKGAQF